MEQVYGPQTPYEVYCFSCRVTFPAEARRCIHCGGRLARRGQLVPHDQAMPHPLAPGPDEDELEESTSATMLRRFGGLTIWALIAASALISNVCRGD